MYKPALAVLIIIFLSVFGFLGYYVYTQATFEDFFLIVVLLFGFGLFIETYRFIVDSTKN